MLLLCKNLEHSLWAYKCLHVHHICTFRRIISTQGLLFLLQHQDPVKSTICHRPEADCKHKFTFKTTLDILHAWIHGSRYSLERDKFNIKTAENVWGVTNNKNEHTAAKLSLTLHALVWHICHLWLGTCLQIKHKCIIKHRNPWKVA